MKNKFLNITTEFLKKNNSYSEDELKKIQYGLEGIYLTLSKTIIILLIAFVLNILKEVVIGLFLFNGIRYFAFGFHAEKSWQCLLLSIFNFVIIPLIFLNINTSLLLDLIICGICILLCLIFAPADTPKRPLRSKKKRLMRKFLTFIVTLFYTILVCFFNSHYISDLLISSLVITVIVINPLTYAIFRQTYNNYKEIS